MIKNLNFSQNYRISILAICLLLFGKLLSQCNANFNFTVGANGASTLVSTSTGTTSSTSYTWLVGNSYTYVVANSQYPNWTSTLNHIFTENQVATVTLQIMDVTNTPTCSSSITKTISVVTVPCYSNITINSFLSLNGLVNFSSQPIGSGGGIYAHLWSFGDGGTSTQQFPAHTYTAGGVYTVTLSAIGYSSICTYSTTQTISVTLAPCNIAAAFIYTIGTNGLIHFKGTSTGTVPGTTYNWDFNDGTYITGYTHDTISHRFPSNITYPVGHSAIISSPFWCVDSLVQLISVTNATSCSAYSILQFLKDTTQNFTWYILASYPSNVSNVSWDWGDNSTSTGLYPSHTYSAAGLYYIQGVVTVSCGSSYTLFTGGYIYRSSSSTESQDIVTINVKKSGVSSVGIKSLSSEIYKVDIWPNPNNGNFELNIEGIEVNTMFDLKISNLLGQSIFTEALRAESSTLKKTIGLKDLPNGTYFLHLKSERYTYATKIIIAK